MAGASGKKLDETYKTAWLRGLKTTYYLRTIGATHTEKSTSKTGALNAVAVDGAQGSMMSAAGTVSTFSGISSTDATPEPDGPVCMLRPGDDGFEECEACQ